jgi:Flp pilus assembly protein TadG
VDDRGSATLETALVIPVLVLLTAALCGAISTMTTQIRCVDAARVGARAAARGEPNAAVQAAIKSAAPRGARTTLTESGGYIQVDVVAPISGLPLLNTITTHAEAEAASEEDQPP